VRFTNATNPLDQPGHGFGGTRIAHRLEDARTSGQIRKYDGGMRGHFLCVQYLSIVGADYGKALARWPQTIRTELRRVKS
jgi:hypothetical protein